MSQRAMPRLGLRHVAVGLLVIGLAWLLLALTVLPGSSNWGEDFVAYRDAAMRLAETGTLYLPESLTGEVEPQGQFLYLYPPPLGIAFGPFTGLDPETGAVVWYLLKIGGLALAAALMPVRLTTRLLVFGISLFSYAVLRDLVMGNVSMLLPIALAAGWRWLDRPVGSIALAVATSVRVTTGAFLIWFAMRRAWRPLAWMVGAGMALIVISLPFVGIDGYRDYFAVLGNVSGTGTLSQNRHITALAIELGLPTDKLWLVLVPTWALALGAMALSTRRDAATGYMVTAGAALLLAPLMWDHYLSMLLLPAAFLFERGRRWAILLPLLSWAPVPLVPLVAIAALLLPFLARDPEPRTEATPEPTAGTA
jgi:hypothetical protein